MPLQLAWYCEHKRKYFHTKEKYVEHLRVLAHKRYHGRQRLKYQHKLDTLITEASPDIATSEQLFNFMQENVGTAIRLACHVLKVSPSEYSVSKYAEALPVIANVRLLKIIPDTRRILPSLIIKVEYCFFDLPGRIIYEVFDAFGLCCDFSAPGEFIVDLDKWEGLRGLVKCDYDRQRVEWEKDKLVNTIQGSSLDTFGYTETHL